jgi:8-oxo-dGTP diphosphatase
MEIPRKVCRNELEAVFLADPRRFFSALRMLKEAKDPVDMHVCGRSGFFRQLDPDDGRGFVVLAAATLEEGTALAAFVGSQDASFFTVDAAAHWPDAANEPAGMLMRGHRADWHNPCRQLSLPDEVVLSIPDPDVVSLSPDQAEYIHGHYEMKHILPSVYLAERIRNGPSVGIFRDGRLVGWSMTHDEGTMGVLEVLPEYRRLGLAEKLSSALCRKVREAGSIPTVQILCGNRASPSLAEKMGFVRTADVTWFGWREVDSEKRE